MTVRPTLTHARRATLGALAAAAAMVACETRRPAPVAPVTDYVIRDGQATALTPNALQAESLKVRNAKVLAGQAAAADDPSRPLIIVDDARGNVVFSGRIGGSVDSILKRVSPEGIERVEVIKGGHLLPPEAKGGLIRVTLKSGATWPGASADSASGLKYKSLESPSTRRDTMRLGAANVRISRDTMRAATGNVRVTGGDTTLAFSTSAERVASGGANGVAQVVILEDASGKALYEGPMPSGGGLELFGPYRVAEAIIDRVEVFKSKQLATIRIRLKPGAVPERVR